MRRSNSRRISAVYLVPSYRTAPGEAEALECSPTSRRRPDEPSLQAARRRSEDRGHCRRLLCRHGARRHALLSLRRCRRPAYSLKRSTKSRRVIAESRRKGRQRRRSRARQDAARRRHDLCAGQSGDAGAWYGASLATGQTLEDVQNWPERIEAVTRGRRRQGGALARQAARRHGLSAAVADVRPDAIRISRMHRHFEDAETETRRPRAPHACRRSSRQAASRPGWSKTMPCRWWRSNSPFMAAPRRTRGGKPGVATLLAGLLDEGAGPYDSEAFHRVARRTGHRDLLLGRARSSSSGRMQTLARNLGQGLRTLAARGQRGAARSGADRTREEPDDRGPETRDQGSRFASPAAPSAAAPIPAIPMARPCAANSRRSNAVAQAISWRCARANYRARQSARSPPSARSMRRRSAPMLDAVFGALPAKATLVPVPDVAFAGPRHARDRRYRCAAIDDPLRPSGHRARAIRISSPAMVVNHMLGGGVFSARLFREVREKRGLAYSVYSQLAALRPCARCSPAAHRPRTNAPPNRSQRHRGRDPQISPKRARPRRNSTRRRNILIGSYALRFDTSTKIAGNLVQLQARGTRRRISRRAQQADRGRDAR